MTCACLLAPTTNIFAASIDNNPVSNVTIESNVIYDGIAKSTDILSEASAVDLSYGSSLAFNVKKLRYSNLFTNNRFTGVKSIKVNISDITVDKNGSVCPLKNLQSLCIKEDIPK